MVIPSKFHDAGSIEYGKKAMLVPLNNYDQQEGLLKKRIHEIFHHLK